jgi:hypothetical protein
MTCSGIQAPGSLISPSINARATPAAPRRGGVCLGLAEQRGMP